MYLQTHSANSTFAGTSGACFAAESLVDTIFKQTECAHISSRHVLQHGIRRLQVADLRVPYQ